MQEQARSCCVSNSLPSPAESAVVAAARRQHAAALRSYVADLLSADRERIDSVLDGTWRALARETENDATDKGAVWLFTEAHRRAVAVQRTATAAPEDDPAAGEDGSAEGRFALLTTKQREVLRLKFVHGFANDEIARIVDLGSLQAARMLHNALARLAPAFRAADAAPALAVDDPRLTLAALGELDPVAWRAWESGQANPTTTNARMEEVRRAAAWVKEHFASGGHRRTPAQRRRHRWPWAVALVALLALGAAFSWWRRDSATTAGEEAGEDVQASARQVAVRRAERGEGGGSRRKGGDANSLGVFRDSGQRLATPSGRTAPAPVSQPGEGEPAEPEGTRPDESLQEMNPPPRGPETPAETAERTAAASSTGGEPRASRRGVSGATSSTGAPAVGRGLSSGGHRGGASTGKSAEATHDSGAAEVARGAQKSTGGARGPARPPSGGPDAAQPSDPAAPASGDGRAVRPASTEIASITALKRALGQGRWPKPEEISRARLLRHFARPPRTTASTGPFAQATEATQVPWSPGKVAVRLAATARLETPVVRAPANLILLLDVSGSMDAPNRWPLVAEAVSGLLDRLQADDRIGVVTYAGESSVLLAPAPLRDPRALRDALQTIEPRGRTNGGAGLEEAFALAGREGSAHGAHLVILCTDGDFNMGATTQAELLELVERHAADGVRLAVFGFGRNGRIDPRLEQLAALAQGGSGYVNNRSEAVSVLFRQLGGLIAAAADDVALEIEVGGEARASRAAESVLPGETVAEVVEVEPGQAVKARLAYHLAGAAGRREETLAWDGRVAEPADTSEEFRFELAVGRLADLLAGPREAAAGKWDELETWVRTQIGEGGGFRAELLDLIAQARIAQGGRLE